MVNHTDSGLSSDLYRGFVSATASAKTLLCQEHKLTIFDRKRKIESVQSMHVMDSGRRKAIH